MASSSTQQQQISRLNNGSASHKGLSSRMVAVGSNSPAGRSPFPDEVHRRADLARSRIPTSLGAARLRSGSVGKLHVQSDPFLLEKPTPSAQLDVAKCLVKKNITKGALLQPLDVSCCKSLAEEINSKEHVVILKSLVRACAAPNDSEIQSRMVCGIRL